MNLRVLSASEVRRALPMAEVVAGMKEAYGQVSSGRATTPLRTHINTDNGTSLFMPAYLPDSAAMAVKVVSVFPANGAVGLPTIHAAVLVVDVVTGRPLALLEGGTLTAIRTGAGTGAATDLLARPGASRVTIFGSGVQARTQLEAVCTVRKIDEVRVFSPNRAHAEAFAEEMAGQGVIPDVVRVMDDPAGAIHNTHIICTATTSHTPVFNGADLALGTHINAVGSFQPTMQEVDETTILRSRVVVDAREGVWAEAGDLIIPRDVGLIDEGHVWAELGEIVAGLRPGREHPDQITYFKSVGNAAQDTVSAAIALRNAEKMGLGTVVDF